MDAGTPWPADSPESSPAVRWGIGLGTYALIVWALWTAAHAFGIPRDLHGHFVGPFVAVALMLGVLWAFGWGAGEPLARCLSIEQPLGSARHAVRLTLPSIARVGAPGAFAAGIYLLIAMPLDELSAWALLLYFVFPSLLAAVLEYVPPGPKLGWQDV